MTAQGSLTGRDIYDLCVSVHADNVAAGWWNDLKTGASLIGVRNVGELLMLCVSELCEAAEGYAGRLMDDKLPHRLMLEVELADFDIRVFDLGGGLSIEHELQNAFNYARPRLASIYAPLATPEDHLLRMIRFVSAAMEHHRKGRIADMATPLAYALHGSFILGEAMDLDVRGAIAEKRAFNRTRADHQVENRKADGGKAY